MTRTLRTLGVVLAAVMATTAMLASSAQAITITPMFMIDADSGIISAEQIGGSHKFTANAGSTSCTGASFAGTATKEQEMTQTVHPTYTGCTAFGFGATVTTTGCDYEFEPETVVEAGMEHTGTVDIKCETGKKIKVAALGGACTVEVGPQENLGTVDFITNTGAIEDIEVKATVGGIAYSQSGFFCANGNFTNGTYVGDTTVRVTDTEDNPVDATIVEVTVE